MFWGVYVAHIVRDQLHNKDLIQNAVFIRGFVQFHNPEYEPGTPMIWYPLTET